MSEADAMAWASIGNGTPGNECRLERSRDGGATWEGPLGQAAVRSTQRRSLIADPAHHRRGVLRACGDADSGAGCSPLD